MRVAIEATIFSPDGNRLLTTGYKEEKGEYDYIKSYITRLWDTHNGQLLAVLEKEDKSEPFDAAKFSSNSKRLLTKSYFYDNKKANYIIQLWNADNGQLLAVLKEHKSRINHMEFSPDNEKIITVSGSIKDYESDYESDNAARLWDANNGHLLMVLKHKTPVNYAAFSPDNKRMITASDGARLWDVNSGQLLATLDKRVPIDFAKFSPDGRLVITLSDNIARLWHILPINQSLVDYAEDIKMHKLTREQREQLIEIEKYYFTSIIK